MIGSDSSPVPKTASEGATCSVSGWVASSVRPASVTEAQAKESEAIAKRANRDLSDFMGYKRFESCRVKRIS